MENEMSCCGLDCGGCDYREAKGCPGCHAAKGEMFHGECKTAKCCLARGLEHCGQCDDFPCSLVKANAFDPQHGDKGAMLVKLAQKAGKPVIGVKNVCQIGFVCRDLEVTAKAWADFLGVPVPKFGMSGTLEESQAVYHGQPCPSRCRQAFFQCGQVQIELIEPDAGDSVWRELMEERGEGLHHIAFDIKQGMGETCAMLETMGYPVVQKGEYRGGRYAYVDAQKDMKLIVELLEND